MTWFPWSGASRRLNLALQGGGAHGAFTWGVLDTLLERDDIEVAAISGTSAGAINAVLLASGLAQGGRQAGREQARATLKRFWNALGSQGSFDWLTTGNGDALRFTSAARWFMQWSQLVSPYDSNPLGLNPLRDLLQAHVDFERLRATGAWPVFVAATQVSTGRLRLFSGAELGVDAVLASTCLPALHHAVEIGGEAYWDGGYSANPAVFPLLEANRARDTLLVLLNPLRHDGVPRSAADIRRRAQDIAFDNTFLREMHMLAHVGDVARRWPWLRGRFERRVARARFHLIEEAGALGGLDGDTRMMAHAPLLQRLHDAGAQRARAWLDQHAGAIGRRSSVDLRATFG